MAIIGTNSGTTGLGRKLIDGFDTVAQAASGGAVDMSRPGTMVKSTVAEMLKTAGLMLIGKTPEEEAASPTVPAESTSGTIKSAASYVAGVVSSAWDKMSVAGVVTLLINFAYKVVMAVGLLLATLVFVGQFVITQIMINIGLALMPLMVPWIMLEATAFIFDGWLKFMIAAAMTKVIGAMIFGLTTGAMEGAVRLANQGFEAGEPGVMFMSYAASFLIVGILALLMSQSVSIAHGLIAGRAGGSWNPVGKLAPGRGMAAGASGAGQATVAAGRGAASAANRTVGAVAGGISGAVTGAVSGASKGNTPAGRFGRSVGGLVAGGVTGAARGGGKGAAQMIKGSAAAKIAQLRGGSPAAAPSPAGTAAKGKGGTP